VKNKTKLQATSAKSQSKVPVGKAANSTSSSDLLSALDQFFTKRRLLFLYVGLFLTVLFSFLLFDIKVSTGGDDSDYITMAYNFIHKFKYPTFQGPLYPVFLSLFVGVFGIKLFVLKFVSLLCVAASMFFFYKTFSGKLPQSIVGFSFIFLSINAFLLYYSSQTYSEAFFLLLQSVVIWYVSTRVKPDGIENDSPKFYMILGAMLFAVTLARNVALASAIGIVAFFILQKDKWKKIPYLLGSFAFFYVGFSFLRKIIWKNESVQIASQGKAIFYKNYFNPAQGNEDFMGFVQRFWDNSNLFFSKHIYNFFGFKIGSIEVSPFLTIITWAIFLAGFFLFFRKNKVLFLISIYTMAMVSVTFLAVQKQWDQSRMIIVYLPYFVLLISGLFYYWFKQNNKAFQFVLPVFFLVVTLATLKHTANNVKVQSEVLSHNIQGDKYYGLTPDWVNYLKMSEWAAKNVPANELIAARKAPICFIYSGGRDFFGIYKVPILSVDTVKNDLMKRNARIIVLDNYELEKLRVPQSAFDSCRSSIKNLVLNEQHFYTIFEPKPDQYDKLLAHLTKYKLTLYTDLNTFFGTLKASNLSYYAEDPDYLIQYLQSNNIKHLLIASLRENPSVKTGNVINTLHKIIFFIQLKYPSLFRTVHQIGTDDDEPAQLVEIMYNRK
jgi:hypothetical protein